MRRRSPQREMSAWKIRVAELLRKEARCPGCAKARRLAGEGTNLPAICDAHHHIRNQMAFGKRRLS